MFVIKTFLAMLAMLTLTACAERNGDIPYFCRCRKH
jgi:hypothetical protein